MIIDLRTTQMRGTSYDLCIIGAGAAGITIARHFIGKAIRVCVIESGGESLEPATQALYEGQYAGSFEKANTTYAMRSRLRFLGGATNHWAGYCSPLLASDFEERPWAGTPGWPITRAEIDPWYQSAAQVLEIQPVEHDRDNGYSPDRHLGLLGVHADLKTALFHLSPPTRFGTRYRADLADADNVHLVLNANVVGLETGGTDRVKQVLARTLDGKTVQVSAGMFVLACGALENARLLLHFNEMHENRLGNQADLVGRHFMDHTQIRAVGKIWRTRTERMRPYLSVGKDDALGHRTKAALFLNDELLRQRELPHFVVHPIHMFREESAEATVSGAIRDLARSIDADIRRTGGLDTPDLDQLAMIVEPMPDPANRVELGTERDALGLRKIVVRYQMPEDLPTTLERCLRAFLEVLGAAGLGRGKSTLSPDLSRWVDLGHYDHLQSHHMGTARMSSSPKSGVVDADSRVYGTHNLFVAGSAVFPSAGFVNPTYTIVALALRLAAHLDARLTGGGR